MSDLQVLLAAVGPISGIWMNQAIVALVKMRLGMTMRDAGCGGSADVRCAKVV